MRGYPTSRVSSGSLGDKEDLSEDCDEKVNEGVQNLVNHSLLPNQSRISSDKGDKIKKAI